MLETATGSLLARRGFTAKARREIFRAPELRKVLIAPPAPGLPGGDRFLHLVDAVPGSCGLERIVHIGNVLYAFVFQPGAESRCTLFGEDRDAVFPGSASTEHSVELHA